MRDRTTTTRRAERPGARASRRERRQTETAPRRDLYAEVTDRIAAELEQGRIPWAQPWGVSGGTVAGETPLGLPVRRTRSCIGVN